MYNKQSENSLFTQQLKKNLEIVEKQLKEEFIGLNEIITRIVQLITPWYLFPQIQERPVIINLWGMTGVGKTSLVKRLVELLQLNERFYHFDMGNNSDKVDTLKTFFKYLCKNKSGFPFVLALDEFQYANTKDLHGDEVDKAYSRVIWELLDTGKFQVYRDSFGRIDIGDTIAELKFLIAKGVKATNGIVCDNISYFLDVTSTSNRFRRWLEDEEEDAMSDEKVKTSKRSTLKKPLLIKEDVVEIIYDHCSDRFAHKIEVKDYLLQLNETETLAFLEKVQLHVESRKVLDCSKALIFILGNLDEAYGFSSVINPDIDADEFHFHSKKINLLHIKGALQKRFRNEQIARLGNNHLIYPALSKSTFQRIIQVELNKIAEGICKQQGVSIVFDNSINKLLYAEGVNPTQGTRPLFSTIYNLINPPVVSLKCKILEHFQTCKKVVVQFKRKYFLFTLKDSMNNLIHQYQEPVELYINTIRTSRNDDLQAVTAVHESGHALASVFLMGIFPNQIFSVTSEGIATGMVIMENKERMVWSRDQVILRAAVFLAGLVAEKIVFGKENITAGSESDLRQATYLISKLVKKQGLNDLPHYVDIESPITNAAIFDSDGACNEMVKKLLNEAMEKAENCLLLHKYILLSLSRHMATHSSMGKKQFKLFLYKKLPSSNFNIWLPKEFSYRKILLQSHENVQSEKLNVVESEFISLNRIQ